MKNISILFADSIHFHVRNFKSLFDLIDRHKIHHTFIHERNKWVSAYGNYEEFFNELQPLYNKLLGKDIEQLYSLTIYGINIFKVCRDELLSYYLPIDSFRRLLTGVPDDRNILLYMMQIDQRTLLLNFAAAWSWLEFWKEKLSKIRNHTYACIFSGAQIYNRTLLELLKTHPTIPLVLEHFFTGNEYYMEEKYDPIPNNTNLKINNTYNSIIIEEHGFELDRERIKAINKVLLSKNKNVRQPSDTLLLEKKNSKTVTIIGQVINDFSIICTAKNYISTIDFYIELIDKLLCDDDVFIVFKSHPWERQKNNVRSALTLDKINEHIKSLSLDKSSRVLLTEHFNLEGLIKQSDYIVTLCSQSAIEAAFWGMKPIQLGNAFYGQKGFTHDYDSIDEFYADLQKNKLNKYLTVDEYDNLECFLVKFLEKSLISVHKSGILSLEKKLKLPSYISMVQPVIKEVKYKDVDRISKNNSEKVSNADIVHHKENNMNLDNVKSPLIIKEYKNEKAIFKKIKKLKRNPKAFLIDSKHRSLNLLARFLF
ncbi:TPA: capsular biosynthesis protein [Escherichia coli]|nr:capsular biosynthesis protein [Escherichia coli]